MIALTDFTISCLGVLISRKKNFLNIHAQGTCCEIAKEYYFDSNKFTPKGKVVKKTTNEIAFH